MAYPYLLTCDEEHGCGKDYPGDLDKCPHCGASDMIASSASLKVNPSDYTYDIETYPNIFTCHVTHVSSGTKWQFEISPRVNQINEFVTFMHQQRDIGARHVGYNNVHFDYPVVHYIVTNPFITWVEIYNKAMAIIGSHDNWAHFIWDRDRIVPQLDLFKLHHFDNKAKSTSLKALEFAMRMDNIEDLPFDVGLELNHEQMDVLHNYNEHDVETTTRFYIRSLSEIKLRESLSKNYQTDMINFSDSKIGSTILIHELEKSGIECFQHISGRKQPRQTIRHQIKIGEVIFPYVKFEHPEFERIRAHLASLTITETKGVFTELHAMVNGEQYHFGTGGLHMSISPQIVQSNDDCQIIDVDVASYYPNLAIKNKMFPAHLGVEFCDIYEGMYEKRKSYPKGTPENAALKISLNASYGNSNNQYSSLYDSFYTMQTTINGQLLLCMLVEQLIKVPGLTMIQCNTDGVTYKCPRQYIDHTRALCKWWENLTQLELEEVFYNRMLIRDVNNYIAEYEDGKLKRKGAYEYNRGWHQDQSSMVVQRAAEAALVRGENVEEFICGHKDPFDFCLRAKVPRSNELHIRWESLGVDLKLGNIIRYFISTNGGSLVKIAPPKGKLGTWKRKNGISDAEYDKVKCELHEEKSEADKFGELSLHPRDADGIPHDERIHTKNKSKHEERCMSLSAGYLATDCSNMANFDWSTINYDYYINETYKLVNAITRGES